MQIRSISESEKSTVKEIVSIHMNTFQGFFLTFMGKGFLRLMYRSYIEHDRSGILVAFDGEQPVGFCAYSKDMSSLYKYMLKKRLIFFAWYSLGAFLRKPKVFMRLIRAFLKPKQTEREEKYVELASIGVTPDRKSSGIGTQLIDSLKARVNFKEFAYITLETDALENEYANRFYQKNGFCITRAFETNEGRKMFEYRYGSEL